MNRLLNYTQKLPMDNMTSATFFVVHSVSNLKLRLEIIPHLNCAVIIENVNYSIYFLIFKKSVKKKLVMNIFKYWSYELYCVKSCLDFASEIKSVADDKKLNTDLKFVYYNIENNSLMNLNSKISKKFLKNKSDLVFELLDLVKSFDPSLNLKNFILQNQDLIFQNWDLFFQVFCLDQFMLKKKKSLYFPKGDYEIILKSSELIEEIKNPDLCDDLVSEIKYTVSKKFKKDKSN